MSKEDSLVFQIFLYFILIVKLAFLVTMILGLSANYKNNKEDEEKYNELKESLHNLFTLCMGILLLVIFNPNTKQTVCVKGHTKVFLFIFGALMILGNIKKITHMYYFDETSKLWKYISDQTTSNTFL